MVAVWLLTKKLTIQIQNVIVAVAGVRTQLQLEPTFFLNGCPSFFQIDGKQTLGAFGKNAQNACHSIGVTLRAPHIAAAAAVVSERLVHCRVSQKNIVVVSRRKTTFPTACTHHTQDRIPTGMHVPLPARHVHSADGGGAAQIVKGKLKKLPLVRNFETHGANSAKTLLTT